jgi:hypothetical protein
MAARVRLVAALLFAVAAAARAQQPTLGDVTVGVRTAAARVNLAGDNAQIAADLDSLTAFFVARDTSITVDQVASIFTRRQATIRTVARIDRDPCAPGVNACYYGALVRLMRIANGRVQTLMRAQFPADVATLFGPANALGTRVLQMARDANTEKLRRYEIKYGPRSPRLNLAEVGLNYVAQLAVPGFRPSADKGPSPLELVASYKTTDLTAAKNDSADLTVRLVSTGQLGLRVYRFNGTCGTGNWVVANLVHPCQSSGGFFVMGPRDATLLRTWGSDSRAGVYVARGNYHAGYVFGGARRVVVGTGVQIVPFVF